MRMLGRSRETDGGAWYCCGAHSNSARMKQKSHGAKRQAEKRMWQRDPETRTDECGGDCTCICHSAFFAGEEPFCTRCDNDYSNLCTGND